jgi:ketosteroid isomerase-like protein
LVAHAVAPNTVIASGLDDIATKGSNGAPVHRYERFIDTWILRDGRWQCVAEQITLAQPGKK